MRKKPDKLLKRLAEIDNQAIVENVRAHLVFRDRMDKALSQPLPESIQLRWVHGSQERITL